MKPLHAALCFFLLHATASAQSFTPDSTASTFFNDLQVATAIWGDVDGDGLLDLCLNGVDTSNTLVTRIVRNHGDSTFTNVVSALPAVTAAALTFGDFDNDNDIDLFITGADSAGVRRAALFRNDGSGSFTDTGIGFAGASDGDAAFADLDADGDLDLVYCGRNDSSTPVLHLYRNDNGGFVEVTTSLPGCADGAIAVTDFDTNNLPDILLTGRNAANNRLTTLFRNDGGLTFTPLSSLLAQAVDSSAAAWGDYDSDGDPDLFVCGTSDSGNIAQLFRNDGGELFAQVFASIPGVAAGSALWADADNDGDLDLWLSGRQDSGNVVAIFLNLGADSFVESQTLFDTNQLATLSVVDVENDGDLDLLLSKTAIDTTDSLANILYRNNSTIPNVAPATPVLIGVTRTETALELAWTAATDDQTPAAGLTYSLRIGTTPGGSEIKSAAASNQPLLLHAGNAGHSVNWTLPREDVETVPTIYWSVQAIDNSFAGSPFSQENSFSQPFTRDTLATGFLSGINAGDVEWGDIDNDDDLDLLITGQDIANQRIATLFRNDGNGQFTALAAGFVGVAASSAAWGDANNDGFIDLLLTGFDAQNQARAAVYRNNGNLTFTDMQQSLEGVAGSAVLWTDFDGDGYQDIFISGQNAQGIAITQLYRNDHGQGFTLQNTTFTGTILSSVDAADFDNDGDFDLLFCGLTAAGTPVTELHRNDGAFSFTQVDAQLPGVSSGSVRWGDYNNDGFADVLITGAGDSGRVSVVLQNNGGQKFTDIGANLVPVSNGSAVWGDYDNDGDQDILLTGQTVDIQRVSIIYRNDGGVFTDIGAWLDGVIFSSVAWADYDNDTDLDVLLAGSDASGRIARLFRNNTAVSNEPPAAPVGLSAMLADSSINFTWQVAADDATPTQALTYTIRIGAAPGTGEFVSPLANSSGFRQVVAQGNAGHSTTWQMPIDDILNFPFVFWSVQAIDNSFTGSSFSQQAGLNPIITSVRDVPHDQGKKVTIVWKASSLDNNVNTLTHYSIWRAIPADAPNVTVGEQKGSLNRPTTTTQTRKVTTIQGQLFNWEWLADQPAHRRDTYAYTAETVFDSISTTAGTHYFLVAAHTGDANIFFDSLPDSGYSVDNLPPEAPLIIAGHMRDDGLFLSWQKNAEPDVKRYLVFVSTTPDFDVRGREATAVTTDTSLVIAQVPASDAVFVKIVAEDENENRSPASSELAFVVTSVASDGLNLPERFSLYQNYPNPFNPSTQIRFELPEATQVILEIFNLRGERVRTLQDEHKPAGFYTVVFDAASLPTGTYYYKLRAGAFTAVKKMTLVR